MVQASADLAQEIHNLSFSGIEASPFPAKCKQAAALVDDTATDVSSISFADKIMITISQNGRLSQWIHVPLTTASPTSFETTLPAIPGTDTLPASHITPKTLLGGGGEEREALGHMIASQIASLILTRDPEEQRTIIVGLGMGKTSLEREGWFDLLELLGRVV